MRSILELSRATALAAGMLVLLGAAPVRAQTTGGAPVADSLYAYTSRHSFLTATDGTQLAITWWIPTPKFSGERFPALLENSFRKS